ncbi:MAG TPA: tetratricopeptide repeat protein, partial [Terriglobia bacterium]|nr:tetratricopeptide repeat protein [Terriglobia bacterium]
MKISLIRQSWARRKPALAMLALALAASTAMAQDRPRNSAGGAASSNTAEAHLGAGYENLRNNRYDAAAREFQAALALDPTLVLQARFPLAVALFELHRLDESRGEFEAVEKAAGSHPNVEYYLGRIDLQQGKLDAAVHELNLAVAKPPFPDTAYYLGYAYLKRHDLEPAEKWLRQAA